MEVLCKQQSLEGVNFEAVSRWISFWDKKDPDCKAFRNHVFELLWEKNHLCQGYFPSYLRIGPERDVTKRIFNDALKLAHSIASERIFILPATTEQMDRVQMFVVAILHPKVKFTEEIVQALLALQFDDKIGILVAICSKTVLGEDKFIPRTGSPGRCTARSCPPCRCRRTSRWPGSGSCCSRSPRSRSCPPPSGTRRG